MKKLAKVLLYALLAWLWAWVFFTQVPLLMTGGSVKSMLGFMLAVLCVALPGFYIGSKMRAKTK